MPFDASERDGVLTLRLDTPGSPINIFNQETAAQLIEILAGVDADKTRAVVFTSAKPNSFINGVGLLLAHASQTREDIERASRLPWAAYRAVRDLPVPTIAMIEGNCFGCGVEFALNCDYRIAVDTCETQFYMTELNDYLFIPLFGSTWNLPEAVGLPAAIDLLLWGERWSAPRAQAGGLIDAVTNPERQAADLTVFVERAIEGEPLSRKHGPVIWSAAEDGAVGAAAARIAQLPPAYRPVYHDALRLLTTGARQTTSYCDHQRTELECSAASALSEIGKSSYSFFYLRQVAGERAAGPMREAPAPSVVLGAAAEEADETVGGFVADLRQRKLAGVDFSGNGKAQFRLVSPSHHRPEAATRDAVVHLAPSAGSAAGVELYAPAYRQSGRLLELALRPQRLEPGVPPAAFQPLARTLQRYGFEVVRTAPAQGFVSNRLLVAYLAPLLRLIQHGYAGATAIDAELRDLGFVRRPRHWLPAVDPAAVAGLLAPALNEPVERIAEWLSRLTADEQEAPITGLVEDALVLSLLEAVLISKRGREADASAADLIARELLDFPRHLCSLCSWLKRDRVERALSRDRRTAALVSDAAITAARQFVAGGREIYR